MKIISYNVREGLLANYDELKSGNGQPKLNQELYRQLLDFLKREDADVIGLLELSCWTPELFRTLQADSGYAHGFFVKAATRHNMGFLSKQPLESTKNYLEYFSGSAEESSWWLRRNFWHALPMVIVAGVHFFIIHHAPGDNQEKTIELENMKKLILLDRTILMGDFNSLRQKEYTDEVYSRLSDKQHQKFGLPNVPTVVDNEVNLGFVDIFESDPQATAPTQSNQDAMHGETPLRLDYFLVSRDLTPCHPQGIVVKDVITDRLSDHYPLVVTLDN